MGDNDGKQETARRDAVTVEPGSLADRGRRLFEFLAESQQARSSPARTTREYHDVHWMVALPEHPAIDSAHRLESPSTDQPLLVIERIPARPAPEAPTVLERWLDGPTADPDTEPTLREQIPDPDPPQTRDDDEPTLHLDDHPDMSYAYAQWHSEWEAWSILEQQDRPVRDLYAQLFSMYVTTTTHSEELELILGTGLLAWAPQNHPAIQRHLLTIPAAITFDDDTGDLTITADIGLDALSVETDMLEASHLPAAAHLNDIRSRARQFHEHPLHREGIGELIRRVVNSLDANGAFHEEDDRLAPQDHPQATFAPALIVRRRSNRGLIGIFRTIAQEIGETGEVPDGLRPLLDPDFQPTSDHDPSPGAMVAIDSEDDIFLPLPLNRVQLDVIRRVDRHNQTLVQGPPGTGKTHTAAALLTHLLAQGKRVLVTAQTDRALKEVRSKLPEQIKPLAVAVVGTDRSDMADLQVAVQQISARATTHEPEQAREDAEEALRTIDRLRRDRARIRADLLTARTTEVTTYEHAGYHGTLAQIAQQYQAQAAEHEWLSHYLTPKPGTRCPLTAEQATRWVELLRDSDLTADEPESKQRIPSLEKLLSPEEFATLAHAEASNAEKVSTHNVAVAHDAFTTVAGLPESARHELQARMRDLARHARELEQRDEPWLDQALRDSRTGRSGTWQDRAHRIQGLIQAAEGPVQHLGPATDVTVDPSYDTGTLIALAQSLLNHLSNGGTLKTQPNGTVKTGMFTAAVIKSAGPLFDAVRHNNRPPTDPPSIYAFLDYTEGQRLLAALDKAWPATLAITTEDTLHERLQWHRTELQQLHRVLRLGEEVVDHEQWLASHNIDHPNWNDIGAILDYAALADAAAAKDAYTASRQPLRALHERINNEAQWAGSARTTGDLLTAIEARDQNQYVRAHERIRRLHTVRDLVRERFAHSIAMRNHAPYLAEAVHTEPNDNQWDSRIADLPAAWDWARTGAWILEQDATDTNDLQAQIGVIETQLRAQIEELAATRAWAHAVSPDRLTGRSRANLTQYAQLVRRLGKGTGRYAAQRQAEIRQSMDRCRPAVPVWIMPIYRIADQLTVQQNMFDVVIIDEASQAGLEATFLQYLAPKVVVIGDDKQVSPAAVGVDQQQLRDLASRYLHDDPYIASWHDPKRSLFDEASMRFGSRLTLVEHRRCVPEIIGFSNRIAYEPDNIRLIPVRQYGADRLEPIKVIHVQEGYENGTAGNKTNPPEIDAIVDQVSKCLNDPRYDGLTFGVISLQGNRQAQMIENAIRDSIPIEEWVSRELRCGDAAAFQGSERDVVFLSMVSAPEEGQRIGAMTQDMYVQRFNVAASRAKDQLWLFHSITLSQLPNPHDMRHQLLDYCYGVSRRGLDDTTPHMGAVPDDIRQEPFDSLFEQRVYNRLNDRGHTVIPQHDANGYKIDLVVIGAKARLAIECDGDAWHGPDRFHADLARQLDLERSGWQFFRIRESQWYVNQHAVLKRLWAALEDLDIRPSDWTDTLEQDDPDPDENLSEDTAQRDEEADQDTTVAEDFESLPPDNSDLNAWEDELLGTRPQAADEERARGEGVYSWDVEPFTIDEDEAEEETHDQSAISAIGTCSAVAQDELPSVASLLHEEPVPPPVVSRPQADAAIAPYVTFDGQLAPALDATRAQLVDGIRQIVAIEGPVLGFRIHQAYVEASGQRRVGNQMAQALNAALSRAVQDHILIADNPLGQGGMKPRTYRLQGQSEVSCRELGPRTLEQVPPLELASLMSSTAETQGWDTLETLFRQVLHRLGRDRLSKPADQLLTRVLPLAHDLWASDRSAGRPPGSTEPVDTDVVNANDLLPIPEFATRVDLCRGSSRNIGIMYQAPGLERPRIECPSCGRQWANGETLLEEHYAL